MKTEARFKKYGLTPGNTPAGLGIFAGREFLKKELLFKFEGKLCDASTGTFSSNSLQISKNYFIEPHPHNPGRYINHSCDPNSGIKNRNNIVAMKTIRSGEEITLDYAIAIYNDKSPGFWRECGATNCRGFISGPTNRKILPALISKCGEFIPEYMRNKFQ